MISTGWPSTKSPAYSEFELNLLLDAHLLLWAAAEPEKLSAEAMALITDDDNRLYFSAASLWEVEIKNTLQRPDFHVDPHLVRRGLIDNGYSELSISAQHLGIAHLPPIHKYPFDRILVAQVEAEGLLLLTSYQWVAQYRGPIRRV